MNDSTTDESTIQEEPPTFSRYERDNRENSSLRVADDDDDDDAEAEKSLDSVEDENSLPFRKVNPPVYRPSDKWVDRKPDETTSSCRPTNVSAVDLESSMGTTESTDQKLPDDDEDDDDEPNEFELTEQAPEEDDEQSELELLLTDQKLPGEEEVEEGGGGGGGEEEEEEENEDDDKQSESESNDRKTEEEQREEFSEPELTDRREKPCERSESIILDSEDEPEKQYEPEEVRAAKDRGRNDDDGEEMPSKSQRREEKTETRKLFIDLVDLNTSKMIDDEGNADESVSDAAAGDRENEENRDDGATSVDATSDSSPNEPLNSNDLIDQCKKFIEESAPSSSSSLPPPTSVTAESAVVPAVTRSKILDNVNTDLPNTELSNVDISSLDIMEPTVAETSYERVHDDQPQTNPLDDLLDDLSDDFVGFDSDLVNETAQKLRILREKREELIRLRRARTENEQREDEAIVAFKPRPSVNAAQTIPASPPPLPYPTASSGSKTSVNYVYQLTKDKNIFEEQVPSGSKRVKKKRKLYGDFVEPECGATAKRISISKEADGVPKKDNTSISCENKENLAAGEEVKESSVKSEETEAATALSATLTATTPIAKTSLPPVKSKRSSLFDIGKPLYKEPFKYGWKREISYRDVTECSKNTKTAYVVYYDPNGKKVKSLKQIAEKLPTGGALSVNNFTFSKERIFADDDSNSYELIRHLKNVNKELNVTDMTTKESIAEITPGASSVSTPVLSEESLKAALKRKSLSSSSRPPKSLAYVDGENRQSKSSKKKKMADGDADVDDLSSTPTSSKMVAMPKILIRNVNSKSGSQKKVAKKSSKSGRSEWTEGSGDVSTFEYGDESLLADNSSATLEYNGYSSAIVHHQKEESRGMAAACSISCPLAMGLPPTLQCTLCLGFYHAKCCGYDATDQPPPPTHSFVCKNCRRRTDRRNDVESRNDSEYLLAVSESSNSVCLVGGGGDGGGGCGGGGTDGTGTRAERSSRGPLKNVPKIVDGLTTWLPSSSNIRLSSSSKTGCKGVYSSTMVAGSAVAATWTSSLSSSSRSESQTSSQLQSVLELEGRRYIIVPKESIVSISPNANATINTFDEFGQEGPALGRRPIDQLPAASVPRSLLNNNNNDNHYHNNNNNKNNNNNDSLNVRSSGAASVVHLPPRYSSANRNQIGVGRVRENALGTARSLKRKYSEESDTWCQLPAKKIKTDVVRAAAAYRCPLTLSNIALMHHPLTLCFRYLTVKELLRVSMSCKYLNCVASDSSLWKIVRLKNSKITDWDGFAKALQKHATRRLDMRKMLCPSSAEDLDTMWEHFFRVIPSVKSLERIDFMRCSSDVVHTVAQTCPHLKVINAQQLKSSDVSLGKFANSSSLKELRLKGFPGVNLEANVHKLKFNSSSLQTLSLTNIKNLNMDALNAIRTLENLRVLEIGECESLPKDFTDILISFKKLEKLRLEKVVNLDPEYKLFSIAKHLKHFKSLELINIEVKGGFDKALKACHNLEEFLLIPLYRKESATANKLIVDGIQTLSKGLKKFVWGLTTELLEITNIFLQEYHGNKLRDNEGPSNNPVNANNGAKMMPKKGPADADSIPITKKSSDKADKVEVDIVPIWQLEMQLATSLPHTKVKVLRIPFNSTGRQSLTDCFK